MSILQSTNTDKKNINNNTNQPNYKVGDYVLIKNIQDPDKKLIGKIEELIPNQNPSETLIRYNQYLFPEDTIEGRQEHNSKNEIYKTNEIDKEYYTNIISLCEVLSYEKYLQMNLLNKSLNSNNRNYYFYRQLYSIEDESYIPELDPSCYCKKIFNPDIEYSQCKQCKNYYHIKCLVKSENKKCPNPECNNKLEIKSQNNNSNSNQLLNKKRIRNDNNNINKDSSNNNKENYNNKDKEGENKKSKATKEQYKNLPEENRKYLINLIDEMEKRNKMLSKTLNESEKMRRNTYSKILYSLLYGIEELKSKPKDFLKKYSNKNNANNNNNMSVNIFEEEQLNPSNINNKNYIQKYCRKLSIEIECLIYLTSKETISANYKKKFFVLYTNLKDERNSELRQSILLHDIKPIKLVNMTSEELAPSSVKKRRVEQQNKYFKEQVFMEQENKLIADSHKGYNLLSVDPTDKNTGGLNPFEILENNNNHINKIKEKINNISSKVNINNININIGGNTNNLSNISNNNTNNKININISNNNTSNKNTVNKNNNEKTISKDIEFKYNKLSSDKLKFYLDLNEYKIDKITNKFNEKMKSNLKSETIEEIQKIRNKLTNKNQ